MRLCIAIYLLWIFSHRTNALVQFDVVGSWLQQKVIDTKKFSSNVLDATCRILSDVVRRYPINPPFVTGVSFQLRTACRRVNASVNEAEKLLESPEFNVNITTIIFIAGWVTTLEEEYIEEMTKAYRCRGENNFLVFNNGGFIVNEYLNAAYHTQRLGKFIAFGLQRLQVSAGNIHLVGHSLGAHIAGSAGRYFYQRTGQMLGRITGLDPARPCFRAPSTFPRLTRGDAAFVDVIHTNPFDVGTEEQIGHVDFFPGGLDVIKPGCSGKRLMCSHELSIQYFVESVYPGNELNFMASRCVGHGELKRKSCSGRRATMGYAAAANLKGIYYLPVEPQWPYGANAGSNATLKTSTCGQCRVSGN